MLVACVPVAEGEGEEGEGEGEGEEVVVVYDGPIRQERSLVWTDAALLDDPAVIGLQRVMTAAAASPALGTTPGELLQSWLLRFSTTAHSERAGPAQLAEQLADTLGPDAATWDLDAAPFKVTAVHNRLDLWSASGGCGELRVSLASTDPIFRPFHVLFLFRQPAGAGDVDGDVTHCRATAKKWAELSLLDGAEFVDAAKAILDEGIVAERFLLAESVELTISPWEWRQWLPTEGALENPPLFEQLDMSMSGAKQAAFVSFVEDNADALDARTLLLPEEFRGQSVRVAQGVPWQPLSLAGLSEQTQQEHPRLRQHLEIVGCAACHTADAEFVQTREDRTFSPFYTEELKARKVFLDDVVHGTTVVPPFGPLQADPKLHD